MKIGLIPGRFAPLHKGHQMIIERAIKEMDKIVVLIYDTNDIDVPLKVRANWIRKLYPSATVIEAYNPPDGNTYAYENGSYEEKIQNEYIKEKIGHLKITHVYHSNLCGDSVSKFLNSVNVLVDLQRTIVPISGTMIRSDLEKYRFYLEPEIYEDCKKYL